MPNLVWRVKLVAELRPGVVTETEMGRIERDGQADLADLGLRLAETKQLIAALQAKIFAARVAEVDGHNKAPCRVTLYAGSVAYRVPGNRSA